MTRDEVISAMRAGARLHMQHGEGGHLYWLNCSMLPVRQDVGDRVIEDPAVARAGDTLFDDTLPQTFVAA